MKVLDVIVQASPTKGCSARSPTARCRRIQLGCRRNGAELGAEVELDLAPLKYQGLSYTEIWISEAQERMVLAVPPEKWPALKALCDSENVEATDLGRFIDWGRLTLRYQRQIVGDL